MATISEDEVAIKFVVETKDLDSRLSEVNKKLDDIGSNAVKSSETASSGFSNFGKSAIVLNQALGLVNAAVTGLNTVFALLVNSLDEAGKVDALTRSFETLQNSVGNDATEALNKLRNATQGLVSDLDLIQASNRAVQLGLPTEGFEEASASAIKLGRAMGIDATQAINDFTTGVGRGSVQILDNLGIIVKANEAYEKFAAANNTTVDALTETEKKLAFQQAAYEAVIESAKNTADVTLNASDAFTILQNTLDNLKNQILVAIANNNDLSEAFFRLSEVIKNIDFNLIVDGITAVIKVSSEGIQAVAFLAEALSFFSGNQVINEASFKRASSIIEKTLGSSANKIVDDFYDVSRQSKVTADDIARLEKQFKALERASGDEIQTNDKLKIALGELSTVLSDAKRKYEDQTKASQLLELANKSQNESVKDLTGNLSNVSGLSSAIEKTSNSNKELASSTNQANDALKLEAELAREVEAGFRAIELAREDQLRQQQKFYAALVNAGANASGGIFDNLFNGANSEDWNALGNDIGAQIGEAAGNVLGGPVGAAVGEVFGRELAESLFKTFDAILTGNRSDIRDVVNNSFGGAGRGLLAVSSFGASELVFSFMGGKNAEANARRAVANLFNDIIDESKLQIRKFDDLGRNSFNPFQLDTGEITTDFGLLFNQLDQSAQSFFLGVGTGLEEVLNISGLAEGQLGQMLAANFSYAGNSANDLQLVLQAMGVSAEDIAKEIEQAFWTGEVSAEQFLNVLAQTEDLFTQGIPGAVGATDIAFDNLGNALESGRVGFDALGDIAAEAAEKGIKSFDELRADLINSGKSVKDVDLLFQSLATNGIGSIEELQNITVRQTAGVINSLEQSGFAFNKVTENVEQLRAELDEIKSKEIDIRLNVSTNYDNNTQELLRNPATAQVVPALGNA